VRRACVRRGHRRAGCGRQVGRTGAPGRHLRGRRSAHLATFLKTATQTLTTSGIGGMVRSWPLYAFIAATLTGTLLQQAALHVGPLSVSQPVLVITDPFASIILSIWLFDQHFTDSPAKITVAVLAFAVRAC
jgi:hypothetical protein